MVWFLTFLIKMEDRQSFFVTIVCTSEILCGQDFLSLVNVDLKTSLMSYCGYTDATSSSSTFIMSEWKRAKFPLCGEVLAKEGLKVLKWDKHFSHSKGENAVSCVHLRTLANFAGDVVDGYIILLDNCNIPALTHFFMWFYAAEVGQTKYIYCIFSRFRTGRRTTILSATKDSCGMSALKVPTMFLVFYTVLNLLILKWPKCYLNHFFLSYQIDTG